MGYNTVAVIMNDATSGIGEDPDFGRNLRTAMRGFTRAPTGRERNDVPAHGKGMYFCIAARLISCESSYHWQTVIVGGNTGWLLGDERTGTPPAEAMDHLIQTLKRLGYKVTKPKPAAPLPATREAAS